MPQYENEASFWVFFSLELEVQYLPEYFLEQNLEDLFGISMYYRLTNWKFH